MDEQLDQFDTKLMAACHDVPVPAGLAERLMAALHVAAQREPVEAVARGAASPSNDARGNPRETVPIAPRRRWLAASCAVAASLLIASLITWQVWPGRETVIDYALARQWQQSLAPGWSRLPAAGFSVPNYIAAPHRWQRFDQVTGHPGVAFDLTASGPVKATLFVIDNGNNALRVDPAQSRPPTIPESTGGGPSIGCWQSGQLVYVLVVEGTEAQYQHFINSVPQQVAQRQLRPAALFGRLPRGVNRLLRGAADRLPASPRNMSFDFRLKQFLRGAGAPASLRHQAWIGSFLPEELSELLHPDVRRNAAPQVAYRVVLAEAARGEQAGVRAGSVDEALRFYLGRYLADDILVKADRASMAASLELRAPFLDTKVVEFAARLPWKLKLSLTRTKVLLRRAMRGMVPDEILGRPKKGFGIPVAAWIRGPLRPMFEELFSDAELRKSGLFEPRAAQEMLQRHLRGEADLRKPLWTLAMFQLWQRRWGSAASALRQVA